jgi:uncharacterized membrane protein (UPF0136 family)
MGFINSVLLVYVFLTLGMGAYGWLVKGSPVSIIAGGVAALLVMGSLAWHKSNPRAGRIMASVVALLMFGQMGMNTVTKGFQWHHLTMTIASLIVIGVLVGGHFAAQSRRAAEQA